MAYNTILVKGSRDRKKEKAAGGTITPGMLIARTSSDTVVVHATAGGIAQKLFALENDLIGDGIDDNYASGDNVIFVYANPGDEVYAIIKDGESIAIGDWLVSDGDGTLAEASAVDATLIADAAVAVALEAVSPSGANGRCLVEVL